MPATSPSVPLGPRAFLRAAGPDAFRFLNGQLTQNVAEVTASQSLPACVLNAKGGLEAVCCVHGLGENDYLLDTPTELGEILFARLDRYLIADEVTLTDESDGWSIAHVLGETSPAPDARPCPRFGQAGFDLLNSTADLAVLDADEWNHQRIELGIPMWGHELTPGLLPAEAGLDEYMISFDKGCYLGQEVISRMKRAGKTNKHLVQLTVPEGTTAPAELRHDGKVTGEITSVSPKGGIALGFRKRTAEGVSSFEVPGSGGQAFVLR